MHKFVHKVNKIRKIVHKTVDALEIEKKNVNLFVWALESNGVICMDLSRVHLTKLRDEFESKEVNWEGKKVYWVEQRGKVGDTGLKAIAQALKNNTSCRNLYLNYNKIDFHGTEALSNALTVNKGLTCLNLSDNQLKNHALEKLGKMLKVNVSLRTLNLSYNQFGTNGMKFLGDGLMENYTLRDLQINGNKKVGEKGLLSLIKVLQYNEGLETLGCRSMYICVTIKVISFMRVCIQDHVSHSRLCYFEHGHKFIRRLAQVESTLLQLCLEANSVHLEKRNLSWVKLAFIGGFLEATKDCNINRCGVHLGDNIIQFLASSKEIKDDVISASELEKVVDTSTLCDKSYEDDYEDNGKLITLDDVKSH